MKKYIYSIITLLTAMFAFSSCEDVPMPYDAPGTGGGSGEITTIEPAGDGTESNPYNITALQEFVKNLNMEQGATADGNVYFKGTIVSIKEITDASSYGNASLYLSDDGTTKNQFYVYRCYGPGNKKFTSTEIIKEGDEVVVYCSKFVNYNGTLETNQNSSYIVSINGNGSSVTPSEPITGENLLANGDFEAWTGGQPDNWKTASTAGNATLSQSTDAHSGSYSVKVGFSADQNKRLAYKELNLKAGTYEYSFYAKSTTSNPAQTQAGYVVVTNGSVGTYNYAGYESISNSSWSLIKMSFTLDAASTVCLVVMNPKNSNYATAQELLIDDAALKTNDGGIEGGTTPPNNDSGEAKGDGTLENPFNSVAANAYASALASGAESDKDVYIKGKVVSVKEQFGTQYGNATFYISDDGTATDQFYVFRCLYLNNEKYTSGDLLQAGDEVIVCGKVTNYMGNTPETVQNKAYLYSFKGNGGGGGQGGDTSESISINGTTVTLTNVGVEAGDNSIECVVNSLNISDKAAASGTYTLSDGSTLTVAQGNGKSEPTYYAASNGFRIYASNTLTFNCKDKIAKIAFDCDSYNGTDYVGNKTATVTFTENGAEYCNYLESNSGGVQLRVKKITITYAK